MSLFQIVEPEPTTGQEPATGQEPSTEQEPTGEQPARPTGLSARTVAIWGPSGAGKSTVALNLAAELTLLGKRVLLVDADAKLPSLAVMLGVTENPPGLTAAIRLINQDRLDDAQWQRITETIEFESTSFDFLAGMNNPRRWRELEPDGVMALLSWLGERYDFVLFDLNDNLEVDVVDVENLKPRHQLAQHLTNSASITLAICPADVVGVNRFLWQVRALKPHGFTVVANRVSAQALGANPNRQLADTLHHFAKLTPHTFLPTDAACDQALLAAKPLLLVNKNSKLRAAIRLLAIDLELL